MASRIRSEFVAEDAADGKIANEPPAGAEAAVAKETGPDAACVLPDKAPDPASPPS